MKWILKFFILIFAFSVYGKSKVQVIPVSNSPENENVRIYIVFPETAQIENQNEVWLQLRLRGYPLGTETSLDRARVLVNSKLGQSIHVVVDNNTYFARIGPSLAPFDEEGNFYESMYKFKIPYNLVQGKHFLRVFPARSYGESLKEKGCFKASYFYVQNKRNNFDQDITDPFITYNEPSGYLRYEIKKPVLLDFYVSNCELSEDGYKVLVTIDRKIKRILTKWVPYYIYGLKKGKHTLRLQLVDKNSKQVEGFFNDSIKSFYVE